LIYRHYDKNIYPSQISKEMFLNKEGAGVKAWREFENLRGDNI
jgi:hypothetical protein